MHLQPQPTDETRYLVIAYLPMDARRLQLEGPVLVQTRDYVHFYLTGTKLTVGTVAYIVIRNYQQGITEEQATHFYSQSFNDLMSEKLALENEIAQPRPRLLERTA
jgi:hypothetical protein